MVFMVLEAKPGIGNQVTHHLGNTLSAVEVSDIRDPYSKALAKAQATFANTKSVNDLCKYIRLLVLDGRFDQAEPWLKHLPLDSCFAQYFRGMVAFHKGDVENGFKLYEWRLELFNQQFDKIAPRWDGKPTDAKLIVWKEGGAGDAFQYARYLPRVFDRCPNARVAVDSSMVRLFEYNFPGRVVTTVSRTDEYDLQCSLCSLPVILQDYKITGKPYLKVPDVWCPYDGQIGFKGTGAGKQASNKLRSLHFFHIERFTEGKKLLSLEEADLKPSDWFDTAVTLSQLRLVISVDTGIAHLAGALGAPLWVMLAKSHDFRWDQPWYDSARTFACTEHSDWEPVFQAMEEELKHV
jgi:hypothetical protein